MRRGGRCHALWGDAMHRAELASNTPPPFPHRASTPSSHSLPHLSLLHELLGQRLECVDGGVELAGGLVPHPVQVLSRQAAPVVTHNDTWEGGAAGKDWEGRAAPE